MTRILRCEINELTARPEVTPAGMRRVEADCDQGAAAVMSYARSLPYVDDVTIFGNSLHLLVDARIPDEQIAGELQKESGAAVRVRPIEASLEDVFVRLTKLQVAARNGQARAAS